MRALRQWGVEYSWKITPMVHNGPVKSYPQSLPVTSPRSERVVWEALKMLPDPWLVFWSVGWQGARDGRQGDGEADFLLLNPAVGILVLEVKGGGISVRNGRWHSLDREGESWETGDPFEQATSSKHEILRQIRSRNPEIPRIPAGHAVVFPDLSTPQHIGTSAHEAMMLCRPQLSNIVEAIESLVDHWELHAELDTDTVRAVVSVLAPDADLRATRADEVSRVGAQIDAWTLEQTELLGTLRDHRRVLVKGGAGTGKTVIAKEKARRLAAEGKSVLVTCFNGPLGSAIREDLKDVEGVDTANFHALCRRIAGDAQSAHAGFGPGVTAEEMLEAIGSAQKGDKKFQFPDSPDAEFWEHGAAELLVEAATEIVYAVDAIVVDEGQDFAPSWWSALELLLKEPEIGDFYVFADEHQSIYRQDWTPPFDAAPFHLSKNCRNTVPIAELVASVYGDEATSRGVPGSAPEFITIGSQDGVPKQLKSILHRLLNEGKLNSSQVVVLCQRRGTVDSLRGLTIAGVTLGDGAGDSVLVETIHRFKGLEADVAVVVLEKLEQPRDQAVAYIGLSRPRAELIVLAPVDVCVALGAAASA